MRHADRPRRKSPLFAGSTFASIAVLGLFAGSGAASANGFCGTETPNANAGIDHLVNGDEGDTCRIFANDTLVIQSNGTVIAPFGNGVENNGGATSVVNNGLVSASEIFHFAFQNTGALGSFVNTGTIAGTGSAAGITNDGTIGLFNNNGGTISSVNNGAIINSGTMTLTNIGGTIIATSTGNAIYNAGTLNLDNANGLVEAVDYTALRMVGGGTLNNTNGIIRAQDGSAVQLYQAPSGGLLNTGGLLTSSSTDDNEGTLSFEDDVGDMTVIGGTIINTNNTSDEVAAVSIDDDQTGTLTFDGVTIVSDGTGVAKGYAFYFYEWDGSINLTASTYVRGQIFQYCCGFVNITTSATIIGDITTEGEADSITVNGGSITGNIAMLSGEDVFNLNGGMIVGNVDLGDDNDTATINGGKVTGQIATGTGDDMFTLNGGTVNGNIDLGNGSDIFTYNGGTLNGNVDFGTGLNEFHVNTTLNSTSQFNTDVAGATRLFIGSTGNLTVNNTIDLRHGGQVNIQQGGRLNVMGGDLLVGGSFYNDGTTQIGVNRMIAASLLGHEITGQLPPPTAPISTGSGKFIYDTAGVGGTMNTGVIYLNAGPADISTQQVIVNYKGGTLTMPTRSLIMTGIGSAALPATAVTDNSFLYDFGLQVETALLGAPPPAGTAGQSAEAAAPPQVPISNNAIYLTLTKVATIEEVATTPNNVRAGKVLLEELVDSTDPVINAIQSRLTTASSQQEFNEILEATQPTVDQGNTVAAVGMTGAMFDLADGQLAMVNTGGDTGVGAGNALTGLHFWSQGFGGNSDQGFRRGVDGYDANVRGIALGVDTRNFHDDTVVGLSVGLAGTNVRSDNANSTRTDIDSYQVMLYGNHELGGNSFITGMAVYGWNDNEQTRYNVGGTPGLTAEADYESWTGGLRASMGRNFQYGPIMGADRFQLTPQLFSEYVHFNRDGYAETGAGGTSLTTGDASQTILNAGISLQAEWTYVRDDGSKLKPDVHVSYKYDLMDDAADTTASFAAGGSTFAVEGVDPANSVFGIGAGLKFFDVSGWDFTANYDYTFKSEYEAHSAFFRAAYEF